MASPRARFDQDPGAAPVVAEGLVSLVFLISGTAGLIFEVVWFHQLGLVFGNTSWATSIVLSTFMGGLALGNALVLRYADHVRRWFRAYAALELAIAAGGIALALGLPHLSAAIGLFARAFSDTPWLVNLFRLATAFVVLMLPATAMGATLPILIGALSLRQPASGRTLGRLYAWNTLGALGGVLGAELLLIPRFGVRGSAWTAALLDFGAGAAALWISRYVGERRAAPGDRPETTIVSRQRVRWRLLTCAALAGFGLMALEVIWFRLLSMLVVNTTLAMSLMLAVVLAAIGLGGLAASRGPGRHLSEAAYLPAVGFTMACLLVGAYATLPSVTSDLRAAEWPRILWLASWLTFPTALLSGFLFTMLGEAAAQGAGLEAKAAARLLLANTIGSMSGPIAATFVLLPRLGMERSLFVLATLYCVIGALTLGGPRRADRTIALWLGRASALAGAGVLVAFPFGLMTDQYFARAARPHTADGSEIVATREGTAETIFLTRQAWRGETIYQRLVTNGFSMSGTAVPGKRYMRQFVYLPMLLHQAPLRRVLVVCYGVGVTAAAVTDVASVERIDIVEISPDVVAMSDLIYRGDEHPLHDPRLRLHLEDGRYFLQTTTDRFDLITGEPPPPLTPGTVNIYTREYFQLIHDHLSDRGMASYWLPVARQEGVDHSAIVKAFCEVFEDCSLWNGTPTDLMLLGTRRAAGPVAVGDFTRPWDDAVLGPRLREAGFEQPEQIGATFVGDAAFLRQLTTTSAPLLDNYPKRLWLTGPELPGPYPQSLLDNGGAAYYDRVLDPRRAREAFAASPLVRRLWPAALLERSLPFFDIQGIINRVLIEGANPLRQIEDLHRLLTTTSLERLPYWLLGLGNHPILARVDEMADDGSGEIDYVRGLRELVGRDYTGAARFLEQSQARGFRGTRPLFVYALCLSGNLDAARHFALGAEVANPDQRHFWTWLKSTFGVGP